jgi:hypothetical protein
VERTYQELLQIIHSKPFNQDQQEPAQISEYIQEHTSNQRHEKKSVRNSSKYDYDDGDNDDWVYMIKSSYQNTNLLVRAQLVELLLIVPTIFISQLISHNIFITWHKLN